MEISDIKKLLQDIAECRFTFTMPREKAHSLAAELLSLKQQNEWIPCSAETNPKVGGAYLVRARPLTQSYAEKLCNAPLEGFNTWFGHFVIFETGGAWSITGVWPDKTHEVTHWRELPSPPIAKPVAGEKEK